MIMNLQNYYVARKVGGRKHWRIQLFRLFGRETLANALQINKNGYRIFCKFERESFGNWPSILQICQCFLPPKFSIMQYVCVEILELIYVNSKFAERFFSCIEVFLNLQISLSCKI